MLIYQNTTQKFIQDVRQNIISDIMTENFQSRQGRRPGVAEVGSWQNSLSRVRDLIEIAGLLDNNIALEYEVPYNQSRIDCLLFGKGTDESENVVLIELKQWQSVESIKGEDNFVETYTGGGKRKVAHPAQQVEGYHNYLKGFVSEFNNQPPLLLFSCAYCHNYKRDEGEGLFEPKFKKLMDDFPVYAKKDVKALADKIKRLLARGQGFEIFNRFMQSPIRPSKKLLENVSKVIQNEAVFSLLNEQLVAKNLIWAKINKSQKTKTKSVVIVHGGPGTGKSLIAINILAEAARRGLKVFYGCKSKPFTEGLKHLVGRDGEILFSNLYRFVPARIKENELDILLVDEAHRIEKRSNFQFTPTANRTDMPQVDQLIRCAKTTVFFIDDKQNVRSREIGGSILLKEGAEKFKRTLDEVVLTTQFRCMGSNDYLLWLESTLGYTQEKRSLSKNEIFEFKIFDDPKTMYEELGKREEEKKNSARIVAGFCWPWSQELDPAGKLVKDVQIGDFAMPWETHGKITPPEGYVRWYEWAYKPDGFKQVGCIYTAQGFEFDYVGVIIGKDLIYDPASDGLKADITATRDPTLRQNRDKFETHVKNIYRTLLTRGMRGCYVYFEDKETEKYFKSRMEIFESPSVIPLEIMSKQADGLVPLYSLEAAAGAFSSNQSVEARGWVKVLGLDKPTSEHFVARVVGKSMEPLIPDGSYCLFRRYTGGSREGKIVLAQSAAIQDPENSGSFTVKKYHSNKVDEQDGNWKHSKIELHPNNASFKPIVLLGEDGNVNVLAVFQKVVSV